MRHLCLAILLLLAGIPPALANNPFGLMLWPAAGEPLSLLAARAAGLGVAWFRPPAVFIDRWRPGTPCPDCAALRHLGLNIVLTVRSDNRDARAVPMQSYKTILASVLDAWNPAVLVIENEENLSPRYSAAPDLYAIELAAGCALAHARGIACANGGLSADAAASLAWFTLLDDGKPDQACDFARNAFYGEADRQAGASLCAYRASKDVPAAQRARMLAGADRLMPIYRAAPIDVLNFHWHGHDAATLATTANLLSRLSGKPTMSNDIRLRPWDADPMFVRPLLRAAFASQLKVAVWYSLDTAGSVSLFNDDGSLRPTGAAFARQMSGRK